MSRDDPDLAALTGSRICHDLASPLGAALTGFDFVSSAPGGGGADEMALLRDSLTGARSTLDMLRTAFGRAGEARDAGALGVTVRGHLASRPRLRLEWALDGLLAGSEAKHLALAILCAIHALPRGGTLAVTPASADGVCVEATAEGNLVIDPALWDGLAGRIPLPATDPRQVEFYLLAARIACGDARIDLILGPPSLAITLLQPTHD